ncbi:MAG: AMP-dependent synthetase [Actinobacteria bacterium]|nr:AMP-dependent synthetase [Actinomycetota bacterium]
MLHEVIGQVARTAPDSIALIDGDHRSTFAELADRIARSVGLLAELTRPGDRVAVIGANHHGWIDLYYAAPAAGCVLVFLNHRLASNEIAGLIDRSGATVVVGERMQLERLDLDDLISTDWEEWELDLATAAPVDLFSNDPDAVAWLLFTSGTTAAPKGAMLTHRNVLAAVDASTAARPVDVDDVYLFPFPLCHVAGYNVVHRHASGRPVVLMDRFDAAGFCTAVQRHRVTSTSLAATMVASLLDHLEAHPDEVASLGTLRSIAYGASPMSATLLRRTHDLLGVDFAQGYGMTELAGNAVFLDADAHRQGLAGDADLLRAAGRAAPGVEIRLAEDGEILVRADQVMAGYWHDEDATAAAMADGWLHTGDIGRFDDRGLLHIIDRSKDIIITGGENVSSREVEDVLIAADGVDRVAVVGVPDPHWGEMVCAVVVARDPGSFDEAAMLARARGLLAGFKIPRRVVLVGELPMNASGKVLKNELREFLQGPA